jgi:voltage-gated potassium channel
MNSTLARKSQKILSNRISLALLACTLVLAIGTGGFVTIEGFSLVDGLYMSAITISTVGFGEVQPLSPTGRAFTTGYIVLSFLTLAFTGHALGQSLLEGVWSGRTRKKKMKNQISSLNKHYIICGYGRVGAAAAMNFHELGHEFVVIETNDDQMQYLEEHGIPYLIGDATHEQMLIDAGIDRAVGVLAILDSDPDNLFVVLTARELNPTLKIFARSTDVSSGKRIIKAGADEVISPYMTAGRRIANDMLLATGQISTEMDPARAIHQTLRWRKADETDVPIGATLAKWHENSNCMVVGIRRNGTDMLMPSEDLVVQKEDLILIVENGANVVLEQDKSTQEVKKIVIIDDNPVIVGLYSRLFQKAGFIPLVAKDATSGLALIKHENPMAAVVDYHLPEMSGADVCRQIRRLPEYDHIKLIMFTADKRQKIKQEAHEVGIDTVVVKSPKTKEVIDAVLEAL